MSTTACGASGRESRDEAVEALSLAVAERLGDRAGRPAGRHRLRLWRDRAAVRRAFRRGGDRLHRRAAQAAHAPPAAGVTILHRDWLANGLADGARSTAPTRSKAPSISSTSRASSPRRSACCGPAGGWCVCVWLAAERPKRWEVRHLLEPICREGRLPSMGSESDYRAMAAAAGFATTGFEDVSRQVRRTWDIIIADVARRLATSARYRAFLRDARARNRIFVATLPRLALAYRSGRDALRHLHAS